MSSTPVLGMGVKDLLQRQLRNPLNPCWVCPFAELLIPWRRVNPGHEQGEQQSHTPRWEVWMRHHATEGTREGTANIFAETEWGCGIVGTAQQCRRASLGFHTEIQGCFCWPSAGKEKWRRTLSSCCWSLAQGYANMAIILQQTWHFSIAPWCSTPESMHPMTVLLEN